MVGIDLLNNKGIKFIGNTSALNISEKTFIVVGIARGGTSLVSGSLSQLGVFSGTLSTKPVYEDLRLAQAFEEKNYILAESIIEEYNKENTIWSFKRPSSIHYLNKIHTLCRNPIYLIIFKDIFSVSNRNNISMNLDIINGLKKAYTDYGNIIDFISKKNVNGLLLSYEKVMENKENFIDTISEIIGKELISKEQKQNALDFIEPNPKEYLDSSRITRGIGQIGIVSENYVQGWAKYIHTDKPGKVELYINDIYIDSVEAKDFRQYLLDNGTHSTGHCGYIFHLKKKLEDGDKISVKLSDEVKFLRNSQQIFKK